MLTVAVFRVKVGVLKVGAVKVRPCSSTLRMLKIAVVRGKVGDKTIDAAHNSGCLGSI